MTNWPRCMSRVFEKEKGILVWFESASISVLKAMPVRGMSPAWSLFTLANRFGCSGWRSASGRISEGAQALFPRDLRLGLQRFSSAREENSTLTWIRIDTKFCCEFSDEVWCINNSVIIRWWPATTKRIISFELIELQKQSLDSWGRTEPIHCRHVGINLKGNVGISSNLEV